MKPGPLLAAALLALSLAGCATIPADPPEARSYDASADADTEVRAAFDRAAERGTLVLIAMGANWCHDSRALAGWLETPRFQALIAENFELVYVDVDRPQEERGRNMQIAWQRGVTEIEGTPVLLVARADGTLLNRDTAKSWRNAASRSGDAIYAELSAFAAQK